MKLIPITKLYKKNKRSPENLGDDVMSSNCDVIVIFPIYSQFGAIWKADFGPIVCKTYILINSKLCFE